MANLSQAELIEKLSKIAEDAIKKSKQTDETGACVYTDATGAPRCAVLTAGYCSQLGGSFYPGQSCLSVTSKK